MSQEGVDLPLRGDRALVAGEQQPGHTVLRHRSHSDRSGLRRGVFFAFAFVGALAGCGSGTAHRGRTVTLPAYAGFPATTIVGTYSVSACADYSRAFAREAALFVDHFGPDAAYSADTYYIDIRRIYAAFQADDCDAAALGSALKRRLNLKQQRALVANLPHEVAVPIAAALKG